VDSSTEGMKGGGYYDLHSEYQRRIIEGGDELIADAASGLRREGGEAVAVADYGCGTGAGSVHALRTAILALPDRGGEVVAIHNDVITNDFNQVFASVAGDGGYLDLGPTVYPLAAAGSFFGRVVPDGSVDLGLCSYAAHWYREQPRVEIADGMYHADARGAAREELASQAARDWSAFLGARADELRPGGRLIVQGIGTTEVNGEERVSAAKLLRAMWSVAAELAAEGLLDRSTLSGYTFPVYCRGIDELVAPLAEGDTLAGRLEVVSTKLEEVPNPYWEAYEHDRDPAAYAEVYVQFVRAFAESSLMLGLFEPGATSVPAPELCVRYFAQLRAAVAADPDASRYEAWVARVVFGRDEAAAR
jgi:hypothetical protein